MNTPLSFPPPASWLAVLLLALAVVPGAQAQVNIEKLRSLDVDGRAASLNGDFALLAGNSEAVNVGGGLRFDYRMGKHYAFLIGSARYGESRTRRYQERLFAHLRYTYDLTTRLVGELFGQGERDAFTLLQVRLLAGGGLRIRYFDKDRKRLGIFQGASLMYEFEDLDADKAGAHPATVAVMRWSNYLNLRIVLTDKTNFINTLYVQPRVDAFGDVRILDEALLAIALTKHVTFTTAFSLRHDSRPPGDVKQTDLAMRNGLTVSF